MPNFDDTASGIVHIYSSKKKSGFIKTFKDFLRELPAAHSLGWRFAERSIKARYRQSILGIFWAFIPPIAMSFVWIILNGSKIINLSSSGAPYPLFVITGTLLWSVFSTSMLAPMRIMLVNRNIVVRVNFPREALLINAFYEILFNASVAIFIIIIELILFRVHLTYQSLFFIPAFFILQMLGVSLGLLLLPVSLLYRDLQFGLPAILQFAMYLTPVIYAKPLYGGLASFLKFNPVSPVLTSARSWLLGLHTASPLWQIAAIGAVSLIFMFIGIVLQRKTMEIVIERMGS